MKFLTTSAIVIKSINYSDADRIFSLLTKDYGRISAIAKGVRKIKSRKAGHLDLGSVVKVSLVEGKSMYIIIQAETITSLPKADLCFATTIFEVLEVLVKITHDGPDAIPYFPIYTSFIKDVQINKDRESTLADFYRRVLRLSGFWKDDLATLGLNQLRLYLEDVTETRINSRFLVG